MTLRMYADHKKWPLEEVLVHLEHGKEHREDCENKHGKIDKITRELEIVGDLSEDQVNRLLEIAERCPVHKTLQGPIHVTTSLK